MDPNIHHWNRTSGYLQRNIVRRQGPLSVVNYEFPVAVPELKGRTLLFFSDLHWEDTAVIGDAIREVAAAFEPDWIAFGGDLVSYACHFRSAMDLLAGLEAKVGKFAIPGNWDKRRSAWFPTKVWVDAYKDAGFQLLINEGVHAGGIYFYGVDDCKRGWPRITITEEREYICLLSHNPDALFRNLTYEVSARIDLVLCGHTHAGQVRIPLFGAIRTSSEHGKRFEYGCYQNEKTGTNMVVSAGIGNSAVPFRLFCRPEMVLVRFTDDGVADT